MTRPMRSALLPLLSCAVAGLAFWRALAPETFLPAIGVGLAAGAAAGWLLARPWRGLGLLLRLAGAVAALAAGLMVVTGERVALRRVGSDVATFLTVGIPAEGLEDLGVTPYVVVATTATAASWAALRAKTAWSLLSASAGLIAGGLAAGDAGVPGAVPAGLMAAIVVQLVATSRLAASELPPLVGTSTSAGRDRNWRRPVFIAGAAGAIGLSALALPGPDPFDVRRFVDPDVLLAADENPLAVAARLRSDPPPTAERPDARVEVKGPSPGRLRLAVLGDYLPEGWQQQAVYAVTGNHLVRPALASTDRSRPTDATVTITDEAGTTGLRAAPTAGTPTELAAAGGVRFASDAGLLLLDEPGDVRYRTISDPPTPPSGLVAAPAGTDRGLGRCVESDLVAGIADTLTTGVEEPLGRLEAIGSWLKARHIYDVDAPGGQTLGSVERFLGQDFSLGNLEVFVTSFALLARCADVPVRVVVGYEAPPGDATSELLPTDVTAWVETPIAGFGWVGYDPLPTPQEIDAAVSLAAADPPPTPPAQTTPTTTTTLPAVPANPIGTGRDLTGLVLTVVAIALTAMGALMLVALVVRRRTIARRARVSEPSDAVLLAWTTVMERFVDLGSALGPHLTAGETARATQGGVPVAVTNMLGDLGVLVDRARFGGDRTTPADAGLAWAYADEILARLPSGRAVVLGPLLHPGPAWARARLAHHLPRRRDRWIGTVPAHTTVLDDPGLPDVAGFEIESRLGAGTTAVVYRARVRATGRPVAVKVFRVRVGSPRFDHQRFVWEARVAESVSGRPHLPEVLGSGFTSGGEPYLVTKLYRHGTLLDRVRVGGVLSGADLHAAGRQLAIALDTLHESGVVHGDVKPENVFVDDDDTLVLGDLGTSWSRGRASLFATGGATAAYAAPEVWLGHTPTPASDLYSLGLTLLFAACGAVPRPGSPPDRSEVVDALGGEGLLGLLEVDPHRRVRTAQAAAALFDDVEAPVLPPPAWTVRW